MSAQLALRVANQSEMFLIAPPIKGGAAVTLLDRLTEIDLMVETVAALDDDDLSPELRAEFEHDLRNMMYGTREKVDRTSAVLAAYEAAAAASGIEAARQETRQKSLERQKERLSKHLLAVMTLTGRDKLEGLTTTLTKRKNPASVVIAPETVVPDEYMRTPAAPAPVPDKNLIKAALKDKKEIAGCSLEQTLKLVRS